MLVYKLPIRLLSKFWLIADVPHASLFSDFPGWDRRASNPPAAVQPSRHSAVLQLASNLPFKFCCCNFKFFYM